MRRIPLLVASVLSICMCYGQAIDSTKRNAIGIGYSNIQMGIYNTRLFSRYTIRYEMPVYKNWSTRIGVLLKTENIPDRTRIYNRFSGMSFSVNYNQHFKKHPKWGLKYSLEYLYYLDREVVTRTDGNGFVLDYHSINSVSALGPGIGLTYTFKKRWEVLIDLNYLFGKRLHQEYVGKYQGQFQEYTQFARGPSQFLGGSINYKF